MKLNINGYARHGKDTVADIFCDLAELKKIPASMVYAKAIRESEFLGPYNTDEECYEDRVNYRAEWYNFIRGATAEYGPEYWVQQTLIDGQGDIYVGHRAKEEFLKTKHLFDATIWVDASRRGLPKEDISSCDLSPHVTHDYYIDNGGYMWETRKQVEAIIDLINNRKRALNAYSNT